MLKLRSCAQSFLNEVRTFIPCCRMFTDTALSFSTGLLNAFVDLVSFSGILYTIYPPLFVALLIYSLGGTAISLRLGRPLVGLNFQQEAREADFR